MRKTNYAKYGALMNLVLHSTDTWVRNMLDKVRTYRGSDRKCTGMGLDTSFEHSVKAHKQPVVVPTDARLSAVNVAMTAKRESVRDYDNYLGLDPSRPGNAIALDEDIELLIETFNLCFGSRYSQLKSVQTYSNLANRDVVRADCGATKLGDVWAGVPKWVESLTTTSSDRPEPSIFEPPDVDDPTFIDLDLDDSGSDDDVVLGADAGHDSDNDDGSNDSSGTGWCMLFVCVVWV